MKPDLVCERCGAKQVFDPVDQPRCLDCGEAAWPVTHCYGCRREIPEKRRCPYCELPVLPEVLYPSAVMLCYRNVDLDSIPGRVKALTARERDEFTRKYEETWKSLDDAFIRLKSVASTRMPPSILEQLLGGLETYRNRPDVAPQELLPMVEQQAMSLAQTTPQVPPFSIIACQAILESAPRKIMHFPAQLGTSPRGIAPWEREAIHEHAKSLTAGYGESGALFAVGQALLNIFGYARTLVTGEVHNRNNYDPLFLLYERAAAQIEKIHSRVLAEWGKLIVPAALVPQTGGIIWACGEMPTKSLSEEWNPRTFVHFSDPEPPQNLGSEEGLRAFFFQARIPITPASLSSIVHWLLAPFPWGSTIAGIGDSPDGLESPERSAFLRDWSEREQRLCDVVGRPEAASKILGMPNESADDRRSEIHLDVRLPDGSIRRVQYPVA